MLTSFNDFVTEKVEFTENYEMTNQLLPIISLELITPDYVIDTYNIASDAEVEDEQEAIADYWDKFSSEMYYNKLVEKSKEFIKNRVTPYFKKLNIGIKNLVVIEVVNFTSLYYDIRTDKLFIDRIVKKLESGDDDNYDDDKMNDFLKEHYKSYDGFASTMPQSKNDLIKYLVKDYEDDKYIINVDDVEQGVAAFLTYQIMVVDGMEKFWVEEFNKLITEDEEMIDPYNFIKDK